MALDIARKIFKRHPVLVNAAVYGGLYVGAEFTQQMVTRKIMADKSKERDLDASALARYLVVGSGINATCLYYWYKWLDHKFVGSSSGVVFKKVLIDQLIMSPLIYAVFYVSMSVMEGKEDIFDECRRKYLKTLMISYLFWAPVQVVNFAYLPAKTRVMFLGACSFAWMNILCWLKSRI